MLTYMHAHIWSILKKCLHVIVTLRDQTLILSYIAVALWVLLRLTNQQHTAPSTRRTSNRTTTKMMKMSEANHLDAVAYLFPLVLMPEVS